MHIVTWNVNSLKARERFVGLFLDAVAPDVLAIQELKLDAPEVPVELFTERGYHVAMHAQPTWNGVLLASKHPLTDVVAGVPSVEVDQARVVAATSQGIRFVNLYCPQGQAVTSPKFPYKLAFYDGLNAWLADEIERQDTPCIVLGDLNVARDPEDVWAPARFAGVPSFHPEEHKRWDALMGLGFVDAVKPHIEPNTYSFWDYRGGAFHKKQGMRIDHILIPTALSERVESAHIIRDWRKKKVDPTTAGDPKPIKLTSSDHAPVGIHLRTT
ncbi:MAG: exodeoxyribonuclease-3 [Myxococcota bacterium]|jgi:exodeoxyribonuclease-3